MKTIKWRVVNDHSLVSVGINVVEKGSVCHVEFIFDELVYNGKTYANVCVGAHVKGGVLIRPMEKYHVDYRFHVDVTDEVYAAYLDFLTKQIGKGYDTIGCLDVLLNHSTPVDFNVVQKWFCSELWVATLYTIRLIKRISCSARMFTPENSLMVSSAMFD